jgi:hypothetical protein
MILIANIPTEVEENDGFIFWTPLINKPFYRNGEWYIGLSRHYLEEAEMSGVSKIRYSWQGKSYSWFIPSKKMRKQMEKNGDYLEKVYKFKDNPLRTYLFVLN